MASRPSRLAPTFVFSNLFIFFKGLHIHMCDQRLILFANIKVALKMYKLNIIVDATFFFPAIVIYFLRHPAFISKSIRLKWNWFYLYNTLDTWSNRRGTYLQCLTHFVGYDVPSWMLLKQTHVYEHIVVFFASDFGDIFFQTKSMLTSDLDIYE